MDPFGGFVRRRWVWFAVPAAVVAVFAFSPDVVSARKRAAASADGFAGRLPPPTVHDHDRRIDFAAETVRLRRIARRAAASSGQVLSVRTHSRDRMTLRVRYGSRTAEIVRDSKHPYHVGESVIVVFDRADPDRVRATEKPNKSRFFVNLGIVSIVAGSLGTPYAVPAYALTSRTGGHR